MTVTAYSPQYLVVSGILAARIRHGDYLLAPIPSTRQLAKELGVSHIVARKAVEKLLSDGFCRQLDNGRVIASAAGPMTGQATVALAVPAFPSAYYTQVRRIVEPLVLETGALFRPVNYAHWNDPVLWEAVNNFSGVFLLGSSEPMDEVSRRVLADAGARIMTVDIDLTDLGRPRLALFDAACVTPLVEHLAQRGAKRVDCLNTQPPDREIERRIAVWRGELERLGLDGRLHNDPVSASEDPCPRAYEAAKALGPSLEAGVSMFCTIEGTALAAARGFMDVGKRPGRDIGLATVGDCGQCRYFSPSITCVEMPDLRDGVRDALAWMTGTKADFPSDGLVIGPERHSLFLGESTESE